MREVKPTQKPVPSSDIKDLFFNSGLLDIWATSLERKYIDRFGNCHLTAAGMEWLFKELVEKFKVDMNTAIVAAGYITVDSFQQGADLPNNELTQRNHILRDETTGEYYRWDGDLPKQVLAGSTPESTGGIGKGAWVSVGDAALRSNLRSPSGSTLVYPCPDVATLRALSGLNVGQEINLLGYHSFGVGIGGGKLYVSSDTSSPDDGFTCFITADGKRVKRSKDTILTVTMAGAVGDGIHFKEDTLGFQRAADAGIAVMVPQPKEFYGIGDYTEWKGIIPANSGSVFYSFANPHIKLTASRCNIFSNFERDFYVQTGSPITDFVIDGLHLDGDMQNLADPASDDFKIGDNYSFGVYMVVMPKSKNVTVKNCHIENFWYGGTNLFGVPNQTTENVQFNSIGSPTAYYPNYAAAGSDASWRFTNQNVKYSKIRIKDCGGGIRANHGLNNGQSPLSENWTFNDIEIRDSTTGIAIYGGQFNDIKFRNCNFFNISKGRVISVTGEGDKWNRDSRVGNVSLDGISIYNCATDDTSNAMVYVYAYSGLCTISNLKIIGGGNTRTHSIVLSGEFVNGTVSSTASFVLDGVIFNQSSAVATHVLCNSMVNLSSSNCTHSSTVSTRVYQLPSGCTIDIRDSRIAIPSFDTSKFIQRNWGKGSIRNIIGFKTKSSGMGDYKDGDKINHGLVESPVFVSAIKRSSGDPLIISATTTASDITLRMFNWNGAPTTTPQTLSWEAYTWHEVNV